MSGSFSLLALTKSLFSIVTFAAKTTGADFFKFGELCLVRELKELERKFYQTRKIGLTGGPETE